jgi:hypothetical protein
LAQGEHPPIAEFYTEVVLSRASIVRLVGAVLAEQHNEWQPARRYVSAEPIAKALRSPDDRTEEVMTIEAAASSSGEHDALSLRTPP